MYVASRELRNGTGGLLKRVQAGEHVVITVRGEPVAELVPFRQKQRQPIHVDELIRRLARIRHDPTFAADIAGLTDETTDDLPIV